MSQAALEGIRVMEVAQWAAAPGTGALLAEWGADVVHIEHPVRGDAMRGAVNVGGLIIDWMCEIDNRNKRSMTLDISKKVGQSVFHRLIQNCDVFITNMRPVELQRYDMEYQRLSRLNPGLIYASLTGYGRNGPCKDMRGYDWTAYWARAGFMAMIKEPDRPPVFPRGGIGDHTASLALACGITTALFARERTGTGQEVDVSLFNTGAWVMSVDIATALKTGQNPPLREREDWQAMTNVYQTGDGKWVFFVHMQQDPYWTGFCRALGLEYIETDDRFSSGEARAAHNRELFAIVEKVMAGRTLAEWEKAFDKHNLIYSPVQEALDVAQDEQAWANGYFATVQHAALGSITLVANPIKLSKMPSSIRAAAPELGQHTEEVLLENGYTWNDITQLKEDGVIA